MAVFLSHGQDVHSVLRMRQVREVVRRSQAQIYWIRVVPAARRGSFPGQDSPVIAWVDSWRDAATNRRQVRQLQATIDESGGRILNVAGQSEIKGAFAEILQELRDQYAVGYYPSEDRDDGSWRRLKVELRQPGLKARAGGGYLDY